MFGSYGRDMTLLITPFLHFFFFSCSEVVKCFSAKITAYACSTLNRIYHFLWVKNKKMKYSVVEVSPQIQVLMQTKLKLNLRVQSTGQYQLISVSNTNHLCLPWIMLASSKCIKTTGFLAVQLTCALASKKLYIYIYGLKINTKSLLSDVASCKEWSPRWIIWYIRKICSWPKFQFLQCFQTNYLHTHIMYIYIYTLTHIT